MDENPYKSPRILLPAITNRAPTKDRVASTVCWLTVFVACICAAAILAMIAWFPEVGVSVPTAGLVLFTAWMLAPHAGSIGVAFLFRRWLSASVIVLLATIAMCGFGTSLYCDHWWSINRAAATGEHYMCCGPPLEIFLPILQWMGVALTAAVAFMISFTIGITSSWIRALLIPRLSFAKEQEWNIMR